MTDLIPFDAAAEPNGTAAPAARVPGLIVALLMLTWFVAPLSGAGFGAIKLVDIMLVIDFLVIILLYRRPSDQRGGLYCPRVARRHFLAIVLMGSGLLLGALRQGLGLGNALRTLQYPVFAFFPLVVLLTLRADHRLRLKLVWALVAGTVFSIGGALFGGELATRGRAIGLTTHMNQLGMTAACALPLILLIARGRSRSIQIMLGAVALFCVVGLNLSGARSALLGAVAMIVLYGISRMRAVLSLIPSVVLIVLIIGIGALTIHPATTNTTAVSALQRLSGDAGSARSDASRTQLLDNGLNALSVGVALVGGVYLEQDTHNIFLTVLVTGGIIAVAGLLLAMVPWLYRAVAISVGAFRSRYSQETYLYSLAVMGFTVWISFNNAIWIRYFWCVLALAVMAQISTDDGEDDEGRSIAAPTAPTEHG
jgi:O-antigen ligase